VEQLITLCPRTEVIPNVELLDACICHCLSVRSGCALLVKETDGNRSKDTGSPIPLVQYLGWIFYLFAAYIIILCVMTPYLLAGV